MKGISCWLSFPFNNYTQCLYTLKYLKSTYIKNIHCWLCWLNIFSLFFSCYITISRKFLEELPQIAPFLADFFEFSCDSWRIYLPPAFSATPFPVKSKHKEICLLMKGIYTVILYYEIQKKPAHPCFWWIHNKERNFQWRRKEKSW